MLLLAGAAGGALLSPCQRQLSPSRQLAPSRASPPRLCVAPEAFSVELTLENGATELVTLTSEASVIEAAEALAEKHGLEPEVAVDVEVELWNRWYQAVDQTAPVYCGVTPEGGEVADLVASLALAEVGLALEVGRSVVAPGAGNGLFVRCTDTDIGTDAMREVALEIGTAVCGYAAGGMRATPDKRGKAVGFALDSLDASVWFERELISVGELLQRSDVDAIAGHLVLRGPSGELLGLELDPDYTGPRYFVPDETQPELSMLTAGQMANDLAVGPPPSADAAPSAAADTAAATTAETDTDATADAADAASVATPLDAAEGYGAVSAEVNLLVLVFRLERDADTPAILLPSRPISTLGRSVTFANAEPMELGCRYGERYWQE